MSTDDTNAARRGSESNDLLGLDDAEVGGFCNVCGGGLRYGERHRRCGDAVMAAVAAERERCARVCEDLCAEHGRSDLPGFVLEVAAQRIRGGERARK